MCRRPRRVIKFSDIFFLGDLMNNMRFDLTSKARIKDPSWTFQLLTN